MILKNYFCGLYSCNTENSVQKRWIALQNDHPESAAIILQQNTDIQHTPVMNPELKSTEEEADAVDAVAGIKQEDDSGVAQGAAVQTCSAHVPLALPLPVNTWLSRVGCTVCHWYQRLKNLEPICCSSISCCRPSR